MAKEYLKITHKELEALLEVSDSLMAIGGCEELIEEAKRGEKAINSILKRNCPKRLERKQNGDSMSVSHPLDEA